MPTKTFITPVGRSLINWLIALAIPMQLLIIAACLKYLLGWGS